MAIGRVNSPVGDYFVGDKVPARNIRARYKKPVVVNLTDEYNDNYKTGGMDISQNGWTLSYKLRWLYIYNEKRELQTTIESNFIRAAFFDDDNNILAFTSTADVPQKLEKYKNSGDKLWEVEVPHYLGSTQLIINKNNMYINNKSDGFYKISSSGRKTRITRESIDYFDIAENDEIITVSENKIQIRTNTGTIKKEKDMGSGGAAIYDNVLDEYSFWGDRGYIYRLDSNLEILNSKSAPKPGRKEHILKNSQDEMAGYYTDGRILQFDSNNNIQFDLHFKKGTDKSMGSIKPTPNNTYIIDFPSLTDDEGRSLLIKPGAVYKYEIVKGV